MLARLRAVGSVGGTGPSCSGATNITWPVALSIIVRYDARRLAWPVRISAVNDPMAPPISAMASATSAAMALGVSLALRASLAACLARRVRRDAATPRARPAAKTYLLFTGYSAPFGLVACAGHLRGYLPLARARAATKIVGMFTAPPGSDISACTLSESQRLELGAALTTALTGDVCFDDGTRAVYSCDSSNYRQVPLGVVFPRETDDVVAIMRICAQAGAPLLGRGTGTSLAGQAVNVGVIVDFSRHMNAIIDIDPVARTATVQPGVVLDDVRRAANAHGLTFGPDPATHAWCTIGGMIGNNSCGAHALYAGKTVDNVRSLEVVTAGAHRLHLGAYRDADYAAATGELARLLGGAREIGRRTADLVATRFPDIPRRVSGYNLDYLMPGRPTNLAKLMVGSESTLALLTQAELDLVRWPAYRHLVVLGYPHIYDAADAVPSLLPTSGLLALEGFDGSLVAHSAQIGLNLAGIALLPPGTGWLLAEVGADTAAQAKAAAQDLIAAQPATVSALLVPDAHAEALIWAVRESGLAATARPPGQRPRLEGWEDAAVPPERLGEYFRRIEVLWDEFGYHGAWYGHFGQGCVHTRNPFDLSSLAGLAHFRSYLEQAADLVCELGGSISGEHGDGQARGELLTRMYGSELVAAFVDLKTLFDPAGLLNPGKLVNPYPLDTNLRHGPRQRPSAMEVASTFDLPADGHSLAQAADRCIGVGRCRRNDLGTMCPSYRATRDEAHATRGRARALAEMFTGQLQPATWRHKSVRKALEYCLSCKGCAVDCPAGVDMATYKAEFHHHFYAHRLRPPVMYIFALLPRLIHLVSRIPLLGRVLNMLLRVPVLSSLGRRLVGLTTTRSAPALATGSDSLWRIASDADPTVVLWPDSFSEGFGRDLGQAALAALRSAGERVTIPDQWACCGRTLYDPGMLNRARKDLTRLLDVLEPYVAQYLPVVVPEPSCLAAFRDELPNLLPNDRRAAALAGLARSLSEHLLAVGVPENQPGSRGRIAVHPHCHGRAAVGTDADRDVLRCLGYDVHIADAGCCGLAGAFGFADRTATLGEQIGRDFWLPRLSAQAAGRTVAMDGFSCRLQYRQLADGEAVTVAELIRAGLERRTE